MHCLRFLTSSAPVLGIALLSAAAAQAQAVRALPRTATDAYGAATNFSTPTFAFHAQYWFASENLPAVMIVNQIGVRVARNAATVASSRLIEITVADVALPFANVSATFAQNLGPTPTTFVAPRVISFPATAPSTDPNVAAAWFPGDNPFVHISQDFVIDFQTGASTGGSTVVNDGLVMGPGAETKHLAGRPSCGGTLAGSYANGIWTLTASGLPAGVPVALNLGFENVDANGVPLPTDLGVIGLPGCHLGLVGIASANLVANAGGQASLALPLQLPVAGTLMLSSQLVHPRVQNPQSITDFGTTNAVHSALGHAGLCNALFAAGNTTAVATQGPQPVNNAVVLLVR